MTDTASHAAVAGGRLRVDTGDGVVRTLHPLWLRERCPCRECRDPRTGQRLLDAWSIPLETAVAGARDEGRRLRVRFSDGHVAPFEWAGLRAALQPPGELDGVVTWDASLAAWPQAAWEAVRAGDAALFEMLAQLHRYGFVMLRGVPARSDAAGEVVARIGPMRRTNWGGIADVKAVADAFDLTMTTRALEPHTDNPYREPVPGYVFLHCLVNDVAGGELLLSDGFRAAAVLREQAPGEFEALTRVRPRFRYADEDAILEHSGPLIELDGTGRVRQIRLSNRTEAVAAEDPDLLERYYRARKRLTGLIKDPALQIRYRWQPGDLLIMDNYRVLHGRGGYRQSAAAGGGYRHMRQCYMDRDAVGSRRRVLARRLGEGDSIGEK